MDSPLSINVSPRALCIQRKLPTTVSASPNKDVDSVSLQKPSTLSSLSRQLSESATRAEIRDETLTRVELCAEVRRLRSQLISADYYGKRKLHDNEIPSTEDPELLERARCATEYIERVHKRDHSFKSPFSGLSREQLDLIAYDESGPYTVNERCAAYLGVLEMESRWNKSVMRLYALEEAAGSPNQPQFCTEVLAHYRTLPLIEQADYADNYESRLEAQINEKPVKGKELEEPMTLFAWLARQWAREKQERAQGSAKVDQ